MRFIESMGVDFVGCPRSECPSASEKAFKSTPASYRLLAKICHKIMKASSIKNVSEPPVALAQWTTRNLKNEESKKV